MSSYADTWQYAHGILDPLDPATGLPKKKKQANPQASFTQQQVQQSLAGNPQSTFGPSPQVDYGFGQAGSYKIPGAPDYKSLIESLIAPLRLELGAQGASDAASRAAQTQRAFTLFGQVPDDLNGLAGLNQNYLQSDITPETRQLAEQNTASGLSVSARLNKEYKDNLRQIKNALAARGALRSGEAGFALQEAQGQRDRADFDARDSLSQLVAGIQAGFAEAEHQRRLQEAGAASDAEGRVRELYPATAPVGGNTAGQVPAAPISGGQQFAPRTAANPAPGYTPMPGEPTFAGQNGPVKPLDIEAILRAIAPPKPGEIRLPGGGGSLSYFGL